MLPKDISIAPRGPALRAACLLAGLILAAAPLAAQTARISYGTKAGFNLALHYAPPAPEDEFRVSPRPRPGAIAGAWMDLEVLPHFSLGYELLYSMKGSREKVEVLEVEGEPLERPAQMELRYDLDYLEMPFLLKVKTLARGPASLQAVAGTAFAYKVRSHHELDGTFYIPDGEGFSEFPVHQESGLKEANPFDFSLIYGAAFQYAGKLRLSAELRVTFGWDYLELPTFTLEDVETDPVELRNQTYSALIGIAF